MITTELLDRFEPLSPSERHDLLGPIWGCMDPLPADYEIQQAKRRFHPEEAPGSDLMGENSDT